MAASSPAANNLDAAAAATTVPSLAVAMPTVPPPNASKNLRGLNKPKCIKCGNVARSRCPYQSCKSCCAKAQNSCRKHGKAPSSASPLFDQQSTEASLAGNARRLTSLQQLSNNFAQFNNLQSPLQSRKPLTMKDAAVINEWRLLKFKEYEEQNLEAKNEAFDRYVQNVSLLDEVFSVNSRREGPTSSHISGSKAISVEGDNEMVDPGIKLMLASNSTRTENLKKRLRGVIDQGLAKLRKIEYGGNELNKQDVLIKNQEEGRSLPVDRASAYSDLLAKLNKAQNMEDLKSCLEMKNQLFNQHKRTKTMTQGSKMAEQETADNDSSHGLQPDYSPQKCVSKATVDQDELDLMNKHFMELSSLGRIKSL